MTKLSPAAQAVLAACGTPTVDSPFRLVARGFAAAALRAAADQLFTDWDATRCSVFLDAIADELDAQ